MPDAKNSFKEPVRIYVLWHGACPEGEGLARGIFHWFRGDPANLTEAGYGIPVLYRSWPPAEGARLCREQPPPIDPARADVNVVVPLVDEHMVVDARWRSFLEDLAIPKADVFLAPVALNRTAYQLPERISQLNFLRLDRANDPNTWSWEERLTIRRKRLLSLLTQVLARLLTGSPGGTQARQWQDVPAPPISIFISHAKADGVDIAERIRNAILTRGQLQVFFDESDLAIGYRYEKHLEDQAGQPDGHGGSSTSAMIAIYTDAYAGRPWCRRELRKAREPVRIDYGDGQVTCWRAKPLLIVSALERGDTVLLPEAGYAPVVTWHQDRSGLVIDRLVREILLNAYHEQRARRLPQRKEGARLHALNCPPDLQLVREILCQADTKDVELLVPPPGPAAADRTMLQRLAGGLTLTTYDELRLSES